MSKHTDDLHLNNLTGPTKPKKVTALLGKLGIDYEDGYFTQSDRPEKLGVFFTAWKKGLVVALLFLPKDSKDWVLEERRDG